jgi:signal transduction histidine kinase
MSLRRYFQLVGWLMIAVGFAFWGYHWPMARYFGVQTPNAFVEVRDLDRALSFGGLFGGALMLYGFTCLGIAAMRERRSLRCVSTYVLIGYGFLGFVTFAKQVAIWETDGGALLLLILILPAAGFLYFLVTDRSGTGVESNRERELREVAGQEERARLAQDLHDSVKQQIYSMQTNLAAAQARWDTDRAGAREALEHARDTARDAMSEMIALLDRLRQDPVESIGLIEALRRQVEALGYQSGAVVTTEFGVLPAPERMPPGAATIIFRIAQEAIANVARHARASRVHIAAGTEDGTHLVMTIRDDGRGFDTRQPRKGMGLASMRSRAIELGARLAVDASEGSGCTLRLSVPLTDPLALRRRVYEQRLLATVLPMTVVLLASVVWPGASSYIWPIMIAGAAFAATQVWPLVRLR